MIGARNYTAVPLQRLEGNQFASQALVGKLLNVEADMSSKRMPDTQFLKQVTGEDEITVEKKYETAYRAKLYSRLIISCNQFPRSSDNSHGFFRRWVVLPFSKKNFNGTNAVERLTSDKLLPPLFAEAPGILNRAIGALAALRQRGSFTESKAMKAAALDFMSLTDAVRVWLEENTSLGENLRVQIKQLRAAYHNFAEQKDLPRLGEKEFSEKVLGFDPAISTDMSHGVRFYVGIGMNAGCADTCDDEKLF
jgi:putative DNA primase/helicase